MYDVRDWLLFVLSKVSEWVNGVATRSLGDLGDSGLASIRHRLAVDF